MMNFVLDEVENIVGKGENAGYQHFLLFLQCFQISPFFRVVRTRDGVRKSQTEHSEEELINDPYFIRRRLNTFKGFRVWSVMRISKISPPHDS